MVHQTEIDFKLKIIKKPITDLMKLSLINDDVIFVRLPDIAIEELQLVMTKENFKNSKIHLVCSAIKNLSEKLKDSSTLMIMGNPAILPYVNAFLSNGWNFHNWIVIRLNEKSIEGKYLKNEHLGVLLYTKEGNSLQNSLIRIGYDYCKFCEKTTKDYGGKKHLYHSFGTSMSDVWRDISISKEEFPKLVIERLRDFFSIKPNKTMLVTSLWKSKQTDFKKIITDYEIPEKAFPSIDIKKVKKQEKPPKNKIWNGDCIELLQKVKDETVDTIFVDPPYNLSKKYDNFSDNMTMPEYYDWCNQWLYQLCRVLKKGGSFFILNIPLSALEHFTFLHQHLHFQNWIVWDALSAPVKKLLPAHYSILYFTKGEKPKTFNYDLKQKNDPLCMPLDYGYCIRKGCVSKRSKQNIDTSKQLTDIWSDIHRIKHNSLREDHPTLLPPNLMKRIISLSSNKDDLVLDCFNGVGSTTLAAQYLNRNYFGIEKNPNYFETANKRHEKLVQGEDPYEKRKTIPTAKNSTLERVKVRKYKVPKRTLQLEVKEIAIKLGRMPTREDVENQSQYPIEYFDNYFRSWYEVTNAVKNTGMTENKD